MDMEQKLLDVLQVLELLEDEFDLSKLECGESFKELFCKVMVLPPEVRATALKLWWIEIDDSRCEETGLLCTDCQCERDEEDGTAAVRDALVLQEFFEELERSQSDEWLL